MKMEEFHIELKKAGHDPEDPLVQAAVRTINDILVDLVYHGGDLELEWKQLSEDEADLRKLQAICSLMTNIPTYQRQ